jgi:C-terminal peptidase prc
MLARVVEKGRGEKKGGEGGGEYALLDELKQRIRAAHVRGGEVSDAELMEFAAKGMLSGLDPHSTFFTSEEFQKFFFDLNREYGGIGAFVNFDQDGDFSIVRPIYSGPAYKAGMKSGDKILEIDGWETSGHTTDEIITRLKGRPETSVTLKVFRPGFQKPEELTIVRRQISVPAVNWAMVPGDIGYVELINFSQNISEELRKALNDLEQRGAKGIVLDVRNNTGGFLQEARSIVEQFVAGKKLVVYTEGPAEPRRNYYTADRNRKVCDLPTTSRRPPARSPPARCRTSSARSWSANVRSARAACRTSSTSTAIRPRSSKTSTRTACGRTASPTTTATRTASTTPARTSS